MRFLSFKGGVALPDHKDTAGAYTVTGDIPEQLIVPLRQHCGCLANPTVKEGDHVKRYQEIGTCPEGICAQVHAPTSGNVIEIGEHPTPTGGTCTSVVIEPDGNDTSKRYKKLKPSSKKDDVLKRIRDAGIVGLGGACFPTHIKLNCKEDIDTLLLNGCECEPYITADHRVMLEHAKEVVSGMQLMMTASNAKHGVIAIESNKPDAVSVLKKACEGTNIDVKTVRTKYPQGAEKMLIDAALGRKVKQGKLPSSVGVIVNNVSTAKAVHDAVIEGIPLTERVVTVTGEVGTAHNILARIGTPVRELLTRCGGITGRPEKVVAGGPMMGSCLHSVDTPIVKGTGCILVMKDEVFTEEHCIRCSRCVVHCPMHLTPTRIATLAKQGSIAEAERMHAMDCFECGTCAYMCPSRIPLVQYIRLAKQEIQKRK